MLLFFSSPEKLKKKHKIYQRSVNKKLKLTLERKKGGKKSIKINEYFFVKIMLN